MPNKLKHLYEFDEFRLDTKNPCLWKNEEMIPLPPKALETLVLLIERGGEIVSREELLETVWKDTFVEEGNINYTISLLRKSLGNKQFIQTIPRRGYRFAAKARLIKADENSESQKVEPQAENNSVAPTENKSVLQNVTKEAEVKQVIEAKKFDENFSSEDFKSDKNIAAEEKNKVFADAPHTSNKRTLFLTLATGGVLLVLLLGGFGFWRYQKASQPINQPRTAEMQFERLTDTGDIAYLAISPDGEFVALNRGDDGISLKDLRSGGEVKLNLEQRAERIGGLRFSPDSRFIYFCDDAEQKTAGKIYQASRFGGTVKAVAENVWSGFSLSPDGRFLAFVRKFPAENQSVLIVKNLEDKSEKEYARRNLPEEYYWNNFPAWSADAARIAMVVVSRTEHFLHLAVVKTENGEEETIKIPQFRNVEQILWSASGNSLIASANTGNNFQVWKINYPNGETNRITNDLNSYLGLSMTADGKKLLARQRIYFSNIWVGNQSDNSGGSNNLRQLTVGTSRNDGLKGLTWLNSEKIIYTSNAEKLRDWNLWAIDTGNNMRQELTFDQAVQNEAPAAAPDGKSVYFTSNRATSARIWRIDSDGANLSQLNTGNETENELYPQISPDGVWCYYIQKGSKTSAIWRKSLIDETKQKLTDETTLSPDTFLSLSPDGKLLAFQNLTEKDLAATRATEVKVGILQTDAAASPIQFIHLPVTSQYVRWNAGGDALEYVDNAREQALVWHKPIKEGAKPVLLFSFPNEYIFNFAWSKDGRQIALSRGQLLRDAVLLSNFE